VLAVGLTAAAYIAIRTGRDAVFFTRAGLRQLPAVYLWTQAGLVLAALVHIAAIKRWGARQARTGLFTLAGLAFIAFVPAVAPGHATAMAALFIFVPVVFAALFASAWLLAGDLLEGAEPDLVRRTYTWVAISGMAGGILGGLAGRALAGAVSPRGLVALGGALLLAGAQTCARAHSSQPLPGTPAVPTGTGRAGMQAPAAPHALSWWAWLRHPYARALMVIAGLSSLASLFVEFQFYAAATNTGRSTAAFFANYYIVVGVVSIAVQLAFASLVKPRSGSGIALLVLPAWILGGAGLAALIATLMAQAGFRVAEASLRGSIHQGGWEQAFLPIERARRTEMKVLVDGVVAKVGAAAGALALYAYLSSEANVARAGLSSPWLTWALVAIAALWIAMTVYLRNVGCTIPVPDEPDPLVRLPDS
jgi:hypothetical protein